jgi:hypothetical protein
MTRVRRRRGEEGGLLIVLMVGVAVMLIGVAVAAQSWSTVWRRDSEEELIFRGNQYVDALMYYAKDHGGQYPVDLNDLMKIGPRQVRYIRKMFRDPVTHQGQWGLLYLMPGGQAIYDPVAAQRATQSGDAGGFGNQKLGGAPAAAGLTVAGVTPINRDPMGTGMNQSGMLPGVGPGQVDAMARGMGKGGATARGAAPGGGDTLGGAGGFGSRMGMRGGGGGGAFTAGGMAGGMAGGPVGWTPGALPPPKAKGSSFEEDSASEPPIGWPIVGVISRAIGETDEDTYRIYKGHEKVSEWQFHVFDRGVEDGPAPLGALPGGSDAPFIGPGFGGQGPIRGFGRPNQGMFPGGRGGPGGGGNRGGPTAPGGDKP